MTRLKRTARRYVALVGASFTRMRMRPDDLSRASAAWMPADGLRLFWFIQTYRDLSRLRQTLARVRTFYPESPVIVVSDGDRNPEISRVCQAYRADFTLRARLFSVEHGGEPVQRMLEAFLRTDADILIKIDPDSNVRRRFAVMPSPRDTSVYGTVQSAGSGPNPIVSVQGGCMIVPRGSATLLMESALLTSDRLKPPALEWAADEELVARTACGLTSYDWTLGWACRELGLLSKDHPEVFSRYRPSLSDWLTERRMAVSHPRFDLTQITDRVFYCSGLRAAVRDVLSSRHV